MAKYTDDLILRESTYSPLTTKGLELANADFDDNIINIRKDFESLSYTDGVDAYNAGTTYDDTIEKYATYSGKTWQWINASPGSGVTPADGVYWQEVFPSIMAHQKNRDTILDEGGANEVTAEEIRDFIDGGLTTTTNLGISTKTDESFVITSSTGADVTLTSATQTYAGLLSAADKTKVDQLTGTNTGDQTLADLNGENVSNKATDFDVVNDTLYPSVQAVATYVADLLNTESFQAVCGYLDTDLEVKTTAGYMYFPYAVTITNTIGKVLEEPTGADITIDLLLNGVSIFGTALLTIDDGETNSETSAVTPTIVTAEIPAHSILTVDIVSIGSSDAGKDLIVTVLCQKS